MTQSRKSELEKLFSRIEAIAVERGKKAALAKYLGVIPQQLNKWLSDLNEPGGEVTLQMLEWVTAEEAQQNENRSSVEAPLRRKTRSTQINHEKRKSSPRKK